MSQSSPSGERSSLPSPRSQHAASGSNPVSSRPGTAGTPRFEAHGGYAPIAPAPTSDVAARQHEYRRESPDSAAHTPSRPLGVHSILNPSSETNQPGLASISQPLGGTMSLGQALLPAPSPSIHNRKRAEPSSPQKTYETAQTVGPRRVLTPKSPGLRAASYGGRRNASFHSTGNSLQPYMGAEPRIYTAEPGSADIPSLPSLAIATQAALSNTSVSDPPSYPPHPVHGPPSHMQPATSSALRQMGSPDMSRVQQGPHGQNSPAFRYGTTPTSSQPPTSAYRVLTAGGQGGYHHDGHAHGPHEGYQGAHASYQMTLDTDQGPMVVPVELDLQQASKVADEKRKRNAGASARFRARRKEKEKEASQTISGLQQELRELAEERDFYRNERNVFRDFAARHVGPSQLPLRPASPQNQRMATTPSTAAEASRPSDESHRARSESGSAIQRRRTGDYQPSFLQGSQSPSLQAYGSYAIQPSLPFPPAPSAQGPYASPRSLPPGPPPNPSGATRSQSYDPFRKDPFDRSWNPGR